MAIKRVLIDLVDIFNDPIDDCFIHYAEDNIMEIYVLIIGQKNTPYEGGFYQFKIDISNKYPFDPPKVSFLSTYDKIRFHPNLYDNGKVCLSILGTWSGPQWTSIMNLRSVVLTLQTLFCENPINCEPGFENENILSNKSVAYNKAITYFNVLYSIKWTIDNVNINIFKEQILKYYNENFEEYKNRLIYLKKVSKIELVKCCYAMRVNIDYSNVEFVEIE